MHDITWRLVLRSVVVAVEVVLVVVGVMVVVVVLGVAVTWWWDVGVPARGRWAVIGVGG